MNLTNIPIKVQECLGYYVYGLKDPRTNEYFYIGKGKGNRILQHRQEALNTDHTNDKCEIIRDIINNGLEPELVILRHNIKTESEAYEMESLCINLYNDIYKSNQLSNAVSGWHQDDFGIQSLEDIILKYDCPNVEFPPNDPNQYICLNANHSYVIASKNHRDIYRYIKEYWILNFKKVQTIDYVLVIYKGIIRNVYKPTCWYEAVKPSDYYKTASGKMIPKLGFDGIEVKDSPLLNTNIEHLVTFNQRGAIYYNYEKGKKIKKSKLNII